MEIAQYQVMKYILYILILKIQLFTGVLTININDKNDNSPIFLLNTLTTERRVFEESDEGSLIGIL